MIKISRAPKICGGESKCAAYRVYESKCAARSWLADLIDFLIT